MDQVKAIEDDDSMTIKAPASCAEISWGPLEVVLAIDVKTASPISINVTRIETMEGTMTIGTGTKIMNEGDSKVATVTVILRFVARSEGPAVAMMIGQVAMWIVSGEGRANGRIDEKREQEIPTTVVTGALSFLLRKSGLVRKRLTTSSLL
mmetsp:Transcript_45128/g.130308  ORF Transcript_45128/g.130308 Transcript_45128/m.130308 type:complete len:151 (-) Transcript_45128:830-1282(-)